MADIKDGGPAFPKPHDPWPNAKGTTVASSVGMSLRDYFAAAALTGLGTWTPNPCVNDGDDPNRTDAESVRIRKARWAYAQADAMLAARNTSQGAS